MKQDNMFKKKKKQAEDYPGPDAPKGAKAVYHSQEKPYTGFTKTYKVDYPYAIKEGIKKTARDIKGLPRKAANLLENQVKKDLKFKRDVNKYHETKGKK